MAKRSDVRLVSDSRRAIGVRLESRLESRDEAELECLQAAAELEARQQWLLDMEHAADQAQRQAAEEVHVACENCGRQLVEDRLQAHQWVCTRGHIRGIRATVTGGDGPPTALARWPDHEVTANDADAEAEAEAMLPPGAAAVRCEHCHRSFSSRSRLDVHQRGCSVAKASPRAAPRPATHALRRIAGRGGAGEALTAPDATAAGRRGRTEAATVRAAAERRRAQSAEQDAGWRHATAVAAEAAEAAEVAAAAGAAAAAAAGDAAAEAMECADEAMEYGSEADRRSACTCCGRRFARQRRARAPGKRNPTLALALTLSFTLTLAPALAFTLSLTPAPAPAPAPALARLLAHTRACAVARLGFREAIEAVEAAERAEGLQRRVGIQRSGLGAEAAAAAEEEEAAGAAARGEYPAEAPPRSPCRHCGRGFSAAARLAAHERVCAQAAAGGFRAQVRGLEQGEHESAALQAATEAQRALERAAEAAQANSQAEADPTPNPDSWPQP